MTEIDREFLRRLAQTRTPGCPTTVDLGRYLDRTGAAELHAEVESHLRHCPACTNELIDLRELQRMEHEGEPAPAALVEKLAALRAAGKRAARRPAVAPRTSTTTLWDSLRHWLGEPRYVTAFAATLLVAVFAVTLLQPTTTGLIPRGALDPARLAAARAAIVTVRSADRSAIGVAVAVDTVVVLSSGIADGASTTVDGGAATVVFRDPAADLAVLRVAGGLTPVALAPAAEIAAPTEVIALGARDAEPVRATLASAGPARWQGDDGIAHEGTLLELRPRPASAPGGVLFSAALELAGLEAFRNDDAAYAVDAATIRAAWDAAARE